MESRKSRRKSYLLFCLAILLFLVHAQGEHISIHLEENVFLFHTWKVAFDDEGVRFLYTG